MELKKLLAAALAASLMSCVGIGIAATQPAQAEVLSTPPPTAVFAWDGVRDGDASILERHNIKAVFLDINHTDCMPRLHDYQIFLLAGDTNWGVEEMQANVDKAVEVGAKGLVFDIEGDYTALAGELEKLRKRVNHRLPILICIPYWLDSPTLERIVRVADAICVMNYNRTAERQQMEEEIKLAKKYHKSIYHAIELQEPGRYGLTPINTYFGAGGVRAAEERYRTEFNDTCVGFAIHSLEMLREEKLVSGVSR